MDEFLFLKNTLIQLNNNNKIQKDQLFSKYISPHQFQYNSNNFIGYGGFGDIYLTTYNSEPVALKLIKIPYSFSKDDVFNSFCSYINELNVLHQNVHPNIVQLKAASLDHNKQNNMIYSYLLLEYINNGTLKQLIEQNQHKPTLKESEKITISQQIASALQYLHSNGIVHCDLHPRNILLEQDLKIKICDFGISKFNIIQTEKTVPLGKCIRYNSPEYIILDQVSQKSDVWSFASVLFELYTGIEPWKGLKNEQIIQQIQMKTDFLEYNFNLKYCKTIPPNIFKIIKLCTEYESKKRPSSEDVFKMLEIN